MLTEGAYVRLALSPHTFGTVHAGKRHTGEDAIIFRQDPRLAEKLQDFFLNSEDEVEECEKPSDKVIAEINSVLAVTPPSPPKGQ